MGIYFAGLSIDYQHKFIESEVSYWTRGSKVLRRLNCRSFLRELIFADQGNSLKFAKMKTMQNLDATWDKLETSHTFLVVAVPMILPAVKIDTLPLF